MRKILYLEHLKNRSIDPADVKLAKTFIKTYKNLSPYNNSLYQEPLNENYSLNNVINYLNFFNNNNTVIKDMADDNKLYLEVLLKDIIICKDITKNIIIYKKLIKDDVIKNINESFKGMDLATHKAINSISVDEENIDVQINSCKNTFDILLEKKKIFEQYKLFITKRENFVEDYELILTAINLDKHMNEICVNALERSLSFRKGHENNCIILGLENYSQEVYPNLTQKQHVERLNNLPYWFNCHLKIYSDKSFETPYNTVEYNFYYITYILQKVKKGEIQFTNNNKYIFEACFNAIHEIIEANSNFDESLIATLTDKVYLLVLKRLISEREKYFQLPSYIEDLSVIFYLTEYQVYGLFLIYRIFFLCLLCFFYIIVPILAQNKKYIIKLVKFKIYIFKLLGLL
jgi:hypothetical protein